MQFARLAEWGVAVGLNVLVALKRSIFLTIAIVFATTPGGAALAERIADDEP